MPKSSYPIKRNPLIRANFHLNEQWALKEFSRKAQFHHYVGAWYMAGRTPDIWYNDKPTPENPTIIKGDKDGKFLYKVIRIPNFREYLTAIGRPATTNYGFERKAIESLCVVPKEPIRYDLKTPDGRPYTVHRMGDSVMRYEFGVFDKDQAVNYDQIELGGWEGIADKQWSSMSAGIIPHLKDLSIYGFRVLLELQDHFRRNYHNPKIIKYAGDEAVFLRNKEDFEKRIGMDTLAPVRKVEEWIKIQSLLTWQSKMVRYIWLPPTQDKTLKKIEQARFGREKARIKQYNNNTRKDNPEMNVITNIVGELDSIMIVLPWDKWISIGSDYAKELKKKTKKWVSDKHGVEL